MKHLSNKEIANLIGHDGAGSAAVKEAVERLGTLPMSDLKLGAFMAMQGVISSPDIVEILMDENTIGTKEQAFNVIASASIGLAQTLLAQIAETDT